MVVRHHALAHRRTQERQLRALDEGAHFVLGPRPGHALADENEWPLGTFEQAQCRLDVLRWRHHTRRIGRALDLDDFVDVAFTGDDVVGHVEIGGAGATIDRVPGCHLDIIGDALHALDAVREFAERRGDEHLALFLECTHAAAIRLRGATQQQHWPAILLGIGEAGEAVHHARPGNDDAGAGPAGQIAVGLRRVGGGLLVAHADIGDAFLLRSRGNRGNRKPNDPEQVIDALLFEAPREQGSAVDFAHAFLLTERLQLRDYALIARPRKGVCQTESGPFARDRRRDGTPGRWLARQIGRPEAIREVDPVRFEQTNATKPRAVFASPLPRPFEGRRRPAAGLCPYFDRPNRKGKANSPPTKPLGGLPSAPTPWGCAKRLPAEEETERPL